MIQKREDRGKQKTSLHLRLTNEDWLACFKDLTRVELGVLFYIRTLDPYGDRALTINCTQLAKALNVHRSNVSKALKTLSDKGYIDLEIQTATAVNRVNNKKLTLLSTPCADAHPVRTHDTPCADATHRALTRHGVAPTHTSSSESQSNQGVHNYSYYSDFFKTLSDCERESFLNFVKEKTAHFNPAISNLSDYLASTDPSGEPGCGQNPLQRLQ
jgi:DNA-binding MarR family transcriptional regulator